MHLCKSKLDKKKEEKKIENLLYWRKIKQRMTKINQNKRREVKKKKEENVEMQKREDKAD